MAKEMECKEGFRPGKRAGCKATPRPLSSQPLPYNQMPRDFLILTLLLHSSFSNQFEKKNNNFKINIIKF